MVNITINGKYFQINKKSFWNKLLKWMIYDKLTSSMVHVNSFLTVYL